jgi:hypothetical protein
MIEKTIPTVSIGTGLTTLVEITPGRTAKIKQLTFTNTAAANRTIEVYDGSGITMVHRVVIGATSTLRPAETLNREIRLDRITAKCLEGTEVTCDGWLTEE